MDYFVNFKACRLLLPKKDTCVLIYKLYQNIDYDDPPGSTENFAIW